MQGNNIMASTPDEFRRLVLEGLYDDVFKGRGTDLEVLVPTTGVAKNSGEGSRGVVACKDCENNDTKSFHLHLNIVAASSRYFATFPEPKMGRVIDDLDSESFSVCVKFMYMGEYREVLTHQNVASILHATELLQIDGLKKNCMDYLQQNLDHGNYEQVLELADRFNNPGLKKAALRFQSKNSSRDELVAKRVRLFENIRIVNYEEDQICDRKKGLKKQLAQTEEQLDDLLQKEHEDALSSMWENAQSRSDGDLASSISIPFALGSFRKSGAIGHLVFPQPENFWGFDRYVGSSTYEDGEEDKNSDSDSDSYYPGDHPPPAPTKDQFEKYGIVRSHCSIETAVEAAKAGDRIYLAEGIHCSYNEEKYGRMRIQVEKALEFIGFGKNSEVIVEIACEDEQCFSVSEGPVGFYNITFRFPEDPYEVDARSDESPNTSQGSGDNAMIRVDSGDGHNSTFMVKNCVFDMGTDCSTAVPTRVSGIFLKGAKSAIIEGCSFLGGAGSAIVAVNDPYLYTPNIEINGNSFISNGQPAFYEKSAKEIFDLKKKKLELVPIPSHEITPGPASVELWRFNRYCGRRERHKEMSIKMVANKFASNLRAPLAHRIIVPKLSTKKANDWQLHTDLPAGDDLKAIVIGFDLLLTDNDMKNNGLQFDEESIRRMKHAPDRKAKKICTREKDQSKNCAFPNGDSLLVIKHFISQYDEMSFPESWGDDEPLKDSHHDDKKDKKSAQDREFDELIDPYGIHRDSESECGYPFNDGDY